MIPMHFYGYDHDIRRREEITVADLRIYSAWPYEDGRIYVVEGVDAASKKLNLWSGVIAPPLDTTSQGAVNKVPDNICENWISGVSFEEDAIVLTLIRAKTQTRSHCEISPDDGVLNISSDQAAEESDSVPRTDVGEMQDGC